MTVMIITGGNTSERKISLISAQGVLKSLQKLGHEVLFYDLKDGFKKIQQLASKVDLFFPIIHGKDGEDGTLYDFLRKLSKPFVGSECIGSKLAFDKILFKKYCDKNGILTSPWKSLASHAVKVPLHLRGGKLDNEIIQFGFPCVLKAAQGGSSKEVVILNSKEDLNSKNAKRLLKVRGGLFVEKLVVGQEITVGVLFNKALPVIEILPPKGKWFDYKNKYSGDTTEIVDSPNIDTKIKQKAQKIALGIHKDIKLSPYSRTDFIVEGNEPILLETNSPCGVGFTPQSLFPKAAQANGLNFDGLIKSLVQSYCTPPR